MATLNQMAYTLLDWRERLNPDGNVADIIEVLAQSNPILQDMTFMISIHAAQEGCDLEDERVFFNSLISIHAAQEGCDH